VPRIGDVPLPDGPKRNEQVSSRRSDETRRKAAGPEVKGDDRVDLSPDARQVEQTAQRLTDEARRLPDVRQDRVEQARARLKSGDYETPGAKREIADRLLEQFGI
jgi:flagellar biosynthesis anti-sigma factor FlgM